MSLRRLTIRAVFSICGVLLLVVAVFLMFPRYETIVCRDWADLDRLPEDTGGQHVGYTGAEWPDAFNGFYIYLPAGYAESPIEYPVLFFFHGGGEMGDSTTDKSVLDTILTHGPPRLIEEGRWNPPVPFIVVSIQGHKGTWWRGCWQTIRSIIAQYPIDRSRVYWTGLSAGGYTLWQTFAKRGAFLRVAAGVPVCGTVGDFYRLPWLYAKNLRSFPIWAFHGAQDEVVKLAEAEKVVNALKAKDSRFPVKFTVFPNLAHPCWGTVYASQMSEPEDPNYDDFDTDIYSWLLRYRRVRNSALDILK